MNKSKVPGFSLAFVDEHSVSYLSYGNASLKEKKQVKSDTIFEIGSMSKAFTALGILLLEEQLKLTLDDLVTQYIPWLQVRVNKPLKSGQISENIPLTLKNLLYHESGLPIDTLGLISESLDDTALSDTVRKLVGIHLDFYPGEKHQYTSINYDILGHIIEIVSGQTYEEFIQKNILKPLGFKNTFLFHSDAQKTGLLAEGYKTSFFLPRTNNAPIYRGNTPAAYLLSNAEDMARWMQIQLGLLDLPEQYKRIVLRSHQRDTPDQSGRLLYYAGGWKVFMRGKIIFHGGNNPSYSSMLLMEVSEKIGICILSNMNSNAAEYLTTNLYNIVQGKKVQKYTFDEYRRMDYKFSAITMMSSVIGLFFFINMAKSIDTSQGMFYQFDKAHLAANLFMIMVISTLSICLYLLPKVLFKCMTWKTVKVWGSSSIIYGCISILVASFIFIIYLYMKYNLI